MKLKHIIILFILTIFSHHGFAICIGQCTSVQIGGSPQEARVTITDGMTTQIYTYHDTVSSSKKDIIPTPFGLKAPTAERIMILNNNGILLGGATKITPENSDAPIYVTARHVLAGQKNVQLKTDSENSENLDLSQFKILQLKNAQDGSWLDIVFLIGASSQIESQQIIEIVKQAITNYSINPIIENWYSWNYGNFDGRPVSGTSAGMLSGLGSSEIYFWLGESIINNTSPGSSGSVIWQASKIKPSAAYPVGVVECMQNANEDESDLSTTQPKPRVIKLKSLIENHFDWFVLGNTSELLFGSPQPEEPNCPHINGRGGGAD